MSVSMPVQVHICECSACKDGEQEFHHEINLFMSRLDEQQRRWFAALEAKRLARGCREPDADLEGRPVGRARASGGVATLSSSGIPPSRRPCWKCLSQKRQATQWW